MRILYYSFRNLEKIWIVVLQVSLGSLWDTDEHTKVGQRIKTTTRNHQISTKMTKRFLHLIFSQMAEKGSLNVFFLIITSDLREETTKTAAADFNTPFPTLGKSHRQEISKETLELNHTLEHIQKSPSSRSRETFPKCTLNILQGKSWEITKQVLANFKRIKSYWIPLWLQRYKTRK